MSDTEFSSSTYATRAYVDAVAAGLTDPKASCRAATTANITLSAPQTIDGVSVIAGDRVLVKDQSTGAENGIYVCAAGAWTRATDADTSAEVSAGLFTFIEEGSTNGDTGWLLSTNGAITLGTTALTFVKFSSLGGDVVGPSSSTDNSLPRFDGAGGKTLQGSNLVLADLGGGLVTLDVTGNAAMRLRGNLTTAAGWTTRLGNTSNLSASSGTQGFALVEGTFAQTGTAGYKALQVNVTETTTGSGQKDLLSLEVSGASVCRVDNGGTMHNVSTRSTSVLRARSGSGIAAGGDSAVMISATSGFGVYFGSGAPTVSASKGSLYLRSDGTGTNDRMYVNTDGGTTWTAVVTVA